jgi:hypothetical protein
MSGDKETFQSYAVRLYHSQMVEVKRRFHAIDRIIGAKKPRTLNMSTDNEFLWLQVRRIVELVAYSAIASDLDRYKALRSSQNGGKVEDDQKVTKIMNRLAGINREFMPVPMGTMVMRPNGVKHFEGLPDDQQATLDRFTELFNVSSEHLHSPNPYIAVEPERNEEQEELLALQSRAKVLEAYLYLKRALWNHFKFGLEFKSGDDPSENAGIRGPYMIFMGPPDTPGISMALTDANVEPPPLA